MSGLLPGLMRHFAFTLVKPLFSHFIQRQERDTVRHWSHALLPYTGLHNSEKLPYILSRAERGDLRGLFNELHTHQQDWDPSSIRPEERVTQFHLECCRILPTIDQIFQERLKSVSLVLSTLQTSLSQQLRHTISTEFVKVKSELGKIEEDTDGLEDDIEQLLGQNDRVFLYLLISIACTVSLINLVVLLCIQEWVLNSIARLYVKLVGWRSHWNVDKIDPLLDN